MRWVRPSSVRWCRRLALLGLGLMGACARTARPSAEGAPPLAGLHLPLVPGAGRGLAVEGRVGAVPARVVLEVAAPLSLVSDACFERPPRGTGASVRVPQPRGGLLTVREVVLEGVRLGDRRVEPHTAGLREGVAACEVVLGSDALAPYALEVDPVARQVGLLPSRPPEAYAEPPPAAGQERRVLSLTRDPTTDWLLLPARLVQGPARLTGPFVLSTGEEGSTLAAAAAASEGLVVEPASGRLALQAVELAPDLALTHVRPRADAGWSNPGALGVLGADVWGRFHTTLDVRAGVLVLRRPAVSGTGAGVACAGPGGEASAAACLALHQRPLDGGRREVGLTVWRELPEGGRVALEARDAEGHPLGAACELVFTFPPSGRGEGLAQVLPPASSATSAPACDWARVAGWAAGPLQPGPLGACAGACVAVRAGEGVQCACRAGSQAVAGPAGAGEAPGPREEEPEPEDPVDPNP